MEQQFVSVEEAMERLSVSRFTLYSLVRKGVLRKYSAPAKPGQTLFSVTDIENAMTPQPREMQEAVNAQS